ncbi:galactose oxidase [Dyadobacter bucti]|uniref:galactose oxidase n=1 Tax=Dyadobacter bucti TaxID=2572203 RepID=UPI0011087A5A|nr:galactose oxidase [Dyadobacter bucti]
MRSRYSGFLMALWFILLFGGRDGHAQSYGLGFASHDVVSDHRTGLILGNEKEFCFDKSFELSFQLSFLANQNDYFGYIFRIVDKENANLDFLYEKDAVDHFKIILGNKFSRIAFNLSRDSLYNSWTKFSIKFNVDQQNITFRVNEKVYTEPLKVKPGSCFKVFFGANDYGVFKAKDIPPMKLRDINVYKDSRLKYTWKLDEKEGKVAHESIAGNDGTATNPIWTKKLHSEWELLRTVKAGGAASVAFNDQREELYIVSRDTLITYKVPTRELNRIAYASGTHLLHRGNQSIYLPDQQRLFNYYIDQNRVTNFNFLDNSWNSNYKSDTITDYWHANKFYSPLDSSLYILGGYGHYRYKNRIQKYHIASKSWTDIAPGGETFIPRYLFAVGGVKNGAYILGGHGSETGQQLLSPKSLYDLLYFDAKTQQIKKLFELKTAGEEFVFAASMIVDEATNTYYALTFPHYKFNSSLQLIRGSLDKPEFEKLGNTVPYLFHDIRSFSDLFYSPASKQFIAVTLLRTEDNQTEVNIYSINNPPHPQTEDNVAGTGAFFENYLIYVLGGIVVLLGVFLIFRKRRRKSSPVPTQGSELFAPFTAIIVQDQQVNEDLPVIETSDERVVPMIESPVIREEPAEQVRSSIFTFGDMQLFNDESEELTKYFTPLIKELYLVILLYTIRWGRGISSEKLKELLWNDKSTQRARNNRSVNMGKLKSILDKMEHCQIVKETGYWKVAIDFDKIYVDYHDYLSIVKDKSRIDKQKIIALSKITQRGGFLSNVDYEWLDTMKEEVSNDIINTYHFFANSIKVSDDPEFLIQVANYIFYFDTVNEDAMSLKCRALSYLGKHSMAKSTYENFCKEYRLIYDLEFKRDFHSVLVNTSLAES